MYVVVADTGPAFEGLEDPLGEVVRERGGRIDYLDCSSEADVIERCADADILVVFKAPITPRVAAAIDAELVVRIGTGFDNVNVRAATEHGIMVSNTPGYSHHQVATGAMTLLLAASRELVVADRALRAADGWGERNANQQVYGATIGIVGLGRIGRAVVPKARGFEMEVIATDPYLPEDVFDLLEVERVGFDDLLARSDFVTIHCPLTAETHHLFSTPEFEAMQDTAVLANVARGPIVDGEALLAAVEAGELFGAGLDVYEREPPNDLALFASDRIICSPHRSGRTAESQAEKVARVRRVVADALDGRHPEFLVNPQVLQYTDEQLNPEFDDWTDGG